MRAVIQRVSSASVEINGSITAGIKKGLLILVGVESADDPTDAEWMADKIWQMRIFQDDQDKMNLAIQEVQGEFLVISQFTLHASAKKGNRPSFLKAARPETAIPLYEYFKSYLAVKSGLLVHSGVFGADMKVGLANDGPVTIILDSKNKE